MNRKTIVILILFTVVATFGLWYYFDTIVHAIQNPKHTFEIIKDHTGLSVPATKPLLIGVLASSGCLVIEAFILGWKQSAVKRLFTFREKSARTDLIYWILGVINLYAFLAFLFTFGVFTFLSHFVNQLSFDLLAFIGNDAVYYIIVFVLVDLNFYIWHLMMHRIGLFWTAHQFHHSAQSFNMLTSSRTHFISHGLLAVSYAMMFALTGTPPDVFPLLYFGREIWAMWLHSNVNVNLGFLGKYLIATPQWHKVHHSIEKKHHDTNFGFLLVCWDRLFGTYYAPEPVTKMGFEGNPFNKRGTIADTFLVIKLFFLKLIK